MSLGLIGSKIGMMRFFDHNGYSVPVTVLDVSNNYLTQIKSIKSDGYISAQVSFGINDSFFLNKSILGHYRKYKTVPGRVLKEFRLFDDKIFFKNGLKSGDNIKPDIFKINEMVDVRGVSIGKGFSGTIKRHNFSSGRASHGNSRSHNVPGSIGMCQDPGKVFRGKKMSGHLGNKNFTIQNLKIIRIDMSRNLLLLLGSVPGKKNSIVTVKSSVKFKFKEKYKRKYAN